MLLPHEAEPPLAPSWPTKLKKHDDKSRPSRRVAKRLDFDSPERSSQQSAAGPPGASCGQLAPRAPTIQAHLVSRDVVTLVRSCLDVRAGMLFCKPRIDNLVQSEGQHAGSPLKATTRGVKAASG